MLQYMSVYEYERLILCVVKIDVVVAVVAVVAAAAISSVHPGFVPFNEISCVSR